MILLVDNQLPVALARHLSASGLKCSHVLDVGLDDADDRVIWQYAKERSMVIISKDEDFQILANRQGNIPPQVVWVRLGNCRKAALLEANSLKLSLESCRRCALCWTRGCRLSRFDN